MRVRIDEPELAAEVQAQPAEHARDDRFVVGDEEEGRARLVSNAASVSSERNFAIGERSSPASS